MKTNYEIKVVITKVYEVQAKSDKDALKRVQTIIENDANYTLSYGSPTIIGKRKVRI